MSSTLKIQSIKFTFHGGRNVQDSIESQRNKGTFMLQNEIVFLQYIRRPACLFVCLCGGIPFNEAASNSDYIQLNDVMITVDQG
jgi:hypothetical protein